MMIVSPVKTIDSLGIVDKQKRWNNNKKQMTWPQVILEETEKIITVHQMIADNE